MSLSKYKNIDNLNAHVWHTSKQAPGDDAVVNAGDFDKRFVSDNNGGTLQKLSTYVDYMEGLGNAVGVRSPYYTIGEIQSTIIGQKASRYVPNGLGSMVRAVTSAYDWLTGEGQSGVIIDGFGDISGDISVEFAQSPVLFVSSRVTDNRMRTPNTIQMKVFVSNYNNDNAIGTWIDSYTVAEKDQSGILEYVSNLVLANGNTRAQQALYNLREIQEQGRPFTVYTPHGVYENMLIKSLKPKTTAENLDMLECDITFQEVIMYETYKSTQTESVLARTNIGDSSLVGWGLDRAKGWGKQAASWMEQLTIGQGAKAAPAAA